MKQLVKRFRKLPPSAIAQLIGAGIAAGSFILGVKMSSDTTTMVSGLVWTMLTVTLGITPNQKDGGQDED